MSTTEILTGISRSHRVARTAAIGLGLNVITNILLYLGQLSIIRSLTRVEFAGFSVAISFVALLSILADLGLTPHLVSELSHAESQADAGGSDKRGEIFGSALALRLSLMIFVVSLAFFLPGWLGYSLNIQKLILIFLFALVFSSRLVVLRPALEAFLRAKGRYDKVAIAFTADAITFAVLLALHPPSLWGAMFIYSLCHIPGFCYVTIQVFKYIKRENIALKVSAKVLRGFFKVGLPLMLSVVCLTVYNEADKLVLDRYSGPLELSAYRVGAMVYSALLFLPAVLAQVLAPELTRLLARKDFNGVRRISTLAIKILFVLGSFAALMLMTIAPNLLAMLVGPKYQDALTRNLLVLYAWAFVPLSFGAFGVELAIIEKRPWIVTFYWLITMCVSIVGGIIVVGTYGALGLLTLKILGLIIGGVFLFGALSKLQGFDSVALLSFFLKWVVAIACSLGLIYGITGISPILTLTAPMLVFLVLLISFKTFTPSEIAVAATAIHWRGRNA